jgi:hypothetical protein
MNEILREVIAKSANDPAKSHGLNLLYQRGHELSGIVRFEMLNGATFRLNANDPSQQSSLQFEGNLGDGLRKVLFEAIEESELLAVPSSTRNIGDDELPIIVEISYGAQDHRLLIWEGDAKQSSSFQQFEKALGSVLRQRFAYEVVIAKT